MTRYGKAGHEIHGKPEGTLITVECEIDGQALTALNGGPIFTFNEAISFQVNCETQEEVDDYREKRSEGGDEAEKPIRHLVADYFQTILSK